MSCQEEFQKNVPLKFVPFFAPSGISGGKKNNMITLIYMIYNFNINCYYILSCWFIFLQTSEDGVRTYTLVIDSSVLTSSYQEFTIVINAGDWVLSYSSSVPATKASLTTPSNSAANLVHILPQSPQLIAYVSVVLYVLLSF